MPISRGHTQLNSILDRRSPPKTDNWCFLVARLLQTASTSQSTGHGHPRKLSLVSRLRLHSPVRIE